jgi:hypothetical protein
VNHLNFSAVPLVQANLCLDCEAITAANTNCLACGSRALLNVARVLSQPSSDVCRAGNPIPISMAMRHRSRSRLGSNIDHPRAGENELLRLPFRMSENRA